MATQQPTEKRDYQNEPAYWFGVLEIARERSDYERAAEALRELRRLGVTVCYSRRQPSTEAPHA